MQPKILILSERFASGDAITGLNIFSQWDKKSLFCASRSADYFNENFKSTYLLGSDEVKFKFPLNIFNKLPNSEVNPIKINRKPIESSRVLRFMYLNVLVPALWFLNLFDGRVTYKVSENFLNWFDDIAPDYIYTSVGTLDMAKFIIELLNKRPGVKVIYHGYDDWVNPNHKCLTSSYSKSSDSALREILLKSSIRFVMSDKMSIEYNMRYNCDFITIPNPALPCRHISSLRNNSVVFVGKIGYHNRDAIRMMAKALNKVSQNTGVTLEFEIYSIVDDNEKRRLQTLYRDCKFMGWRNHDEIEMILCCSRLLFLPISMSKSTIRFTKYSMSTKMSEYLSSGTAILYYGPSGIAMTELLENEKCAYVIKNNNLEILINTIVSVLSNSQIEKEIINNAHSLFDTCFSMSSVTARVNDIIIADYLAFKQ